MDPSAPHAEQPRVMDDSEDGPLIPKSSTPPRNTPRRSAKAKVYLAKCRRRRQTLLCKLDDYRKDFGARVLNIIEVNNRYYVYKSDEAWQPSLTEIVRLDQLTIIILINLLRKIPTPCPSTTGRSMSLEADGIGHGELSIK